MPSFNFSTYNTIYKEKPGVWTLATCGGLTAIIQETITAGQPCSEPSGVTFQTDGTSQCYECVGYESSEIRIVQFNTNPTYSYLKIFLDFDERGGTSVTNKFIYYGRQYGALPTPTRSGFVFDGWFTAISGGTQVISTTTVTQSSGLNQTIYARWSQYEWVFLDSTGSQGGFSEADLYMEDDGSDDGQMIANIEALYPANSYAGLTINYYNTAYGWYTLFISTTQ